MSDETSAASALITELRRAESANLDIDDLLCRAVRQAPLTNANDLAAVLHARLERLRSRSGRHSADEALALVGLAVPAVNVSDPTLLTPIREIESQVVQRAEFLASKTVADVPRWYDVLRQRRGSGPEGELISGLVRDVAAYRELYNVRGDTPLGEPPPADARAQFERYSRLRGPVVDEPIDPAQPSLTANDAFEGQRQPSQHRPQQTSQPEPGDDAREQTAWTQP